MPETRDPAEWASASVLPDHSGLDTLDDLLREAATEELASVLGKTPEKKVVKLVVRVAKRCLQASLEAGGTARADECQARLLAEIIDAPNSKMHAQCIDFVFGYGVMLGVSQTAIAALHGVTKSTVSAICVGIRERYGVRPSRGMKSIAACENYRTRQTGRRAKPTREDWRLSSTLKNAFNHHAA